MFRALLAVALAASFAERSAIGADKNSWPGVVNTKGDEEFEGELLFAKGKLFVNPGEAAEKTVALDQIHKLKFRDTEGVGNRPSPTRRWQNGLLGEYFGGVNLDGGRQTQIDRAIQFKWGQGAPRPGVGADNFSIRWSGEVKSPITGKVNFHATSDDGVRVWVDGKQIINAWTDHAVTEFTGGVDLEKDKRYPIVVEYYERAENAIMTLAWSGPGLAKGYIPPSHFFTDGVAGLGSGGKQKLWLRGGSKLRGTVIALDGKFIEYAVEGGVLRLPIAAVAIADILGWWETPKEIEGRPEGVLLRDGGDFFASEIKGMDPEGNIETFSPLFGKRVFPIAKVRALKFGELEDKPGKLKIRTGSWSWDIRADAIISKGERLIVRETGGQYLNLPLSVIFGIEEIPADGPK